MRFSAVVFAAALVGLVASAPLPVPDDVVTTVGKTVKGLEDGLGVTAIDDELDAALGGGVTALEDKLGVTYLEETIGAAKRAAPGDVQTVGEGIAKVEEGLGVTATEDFLDGLTGGAITKIEDAVGVDTLDKALGLE